MQWGRQQHSPQAQPRGEGSVGLQLGAESRGGCVPSQGKVCGWHSVRVNGTRETELSARLHLSGTPLVSLLDADARVKAGGEAPGGALAAPLPSPCPPCWWHLRVPLNSLLSCLSGKPGPQSSGCGTQGLVCAFPSCSRGVNPRCCEGKAGGCGSGEVGEL